MLHGMHMGACMRAPSIPLHAPRLGTSCFLVQVNMQTACFSCYVQPVQMSFLGVGAPEAILVGVVALVVFGPKGLADVSGAHLCC